MLKAVQGEPQRRRRDAPSPRSETGALRTSVMMAIALCLTVVIGAIGILRISATHEALRQLAADKLHRQVLIERWTHESRINLLRTVAWLQTQDPMFEGRMERETALTANRIDEAEEQLRSLVHETEARRLFDDISAARTVYKERKLDLMLRKSRGEDVSFLIESQLDPAADAYLDRQLTLGNYIDDQLVKGQQAVHRSERQVEIALAVGALLAVCLCIALSVVAFRALQVRRQADKRLAHMALHDPLTGLQNRTMFEERLAQEIAQAREQGGSFTIALINLDGFKQINENLGHAAGNQLLQAVGERLAHSVRAADCAIRLGGDEFALLFTDASPDRDDIAIPLQRVLSSIRQHTHCDGHQVHVTCSIGVATFPKDGGDTETLLRNADASVAEAKNAGGNRYEFYRKALNAGRQSSFKLQAALGQAIHNDELFVVYQPQLDLGTHRIIGVEALLRWKHPALGLVSPVEFIPIAERSGLILEIGEWVLREACRQAMAWRAKGLPRLSVAVNVSARQFRRQDFLATVIRVLDETGLPACDLELELTESMLMHDVDAAVTMMHGLNALGVQLSIDDFGTGYSSLAALKSFPIGRLKIDRSFINDIAGSDHDQTITSAIIELGHKLKLKVIAEGIETPEQLQMLQTFACDEIQGYLLSKPVDPAGIERLAQAGPIVLDPQARSAAAPARTIIAALPAPAPVQTHHTMMPAANG